MSRSFKTSRNEQREREEYRKQQLLRDREYLNQMRKQIERSEAERRCHLAEYLRLKGELE